MIYCHKPCYNPHYINILNKSLSEICFKPKNYTTYIMQKKEIIQKPNFKAFKLQIFTNRKKP